MLSPVSTKANLANNLAMLRGRHGWSQAQVAARAGISQRAVSDVERGVKAASVDTLDQLARAFGVPPWALCLDWGNDSAFSLQPDVLRLVETYRQLDIEGRSHVNRVADGEARYASTLPAKPPKS